MEKITYNYSNLPLYTAIEHVVKNNYDNQGRYYFDLACKDGFYDVLVLVDENGVWTYNAIEIKYPDDEPVLVGITTYEEDGSITYEEQIIPRKTLVAARANVPEDVAVFDDVLGEW